MIIGDCNLLIQAIFPSNTWFQVFNFTTPQQQSDSEKSIIGNISFLMNQIYEKLNLSVLSGEYTEMDGNSVHNILKELTILIENVPLAINLPNNQVLRENLEQQFVLNFIEPLKNTFKDYERLINQLKSKLNNTDINDLFDDQIQEISSPFFFTDSDKLKWIFHTNTIIAKIDHNLAYSKQLLRNLITAREWIVKEIDFTTIYKEILIDKINFLMKKILYRFSSEKENISYTWDLQQQALEHEEIKTKYFKYFDELARSHYDIDKSHSSKNHRDKMEKIFEKERQREELDMIDFHTAIRCYKDDEKNLSRVKHLNSQYKKKYDKEIKDPLLTLFNRNAMYTSYNYMKNNEFSLLIEQENILMGEIDRNIDEIEVIQNSTRIKNYFPFEKACIYYANKIDVLIKQDNSRAHIDARVALKKLKTALDKAWSCYEWCKSRNFNAFQLNYDECKISYEENGRTYILFLASSFVLPISYEKTKIELKELSRKQQMYKTIIEVNENIQIEKNEILEFKRNLEGTDKRYVEILTIFSAIVLFTSSSIQIFSRDGATYANGLRFILCFSYCLALFVFMIWWVMHAKDEKIPLKTWVFLILLACSTAAALIFMYRIK